MAEFDIQKFRRHIGEGKHIQIGQDLFYFKPLKVKHLPMLMELSNIMNENDKAILEKDNAEKLFDLLKTFVKNSYPELDDEVCDDFVANNLSIIMETMTELCNNMTNNLTDKQKKAIESMKQK